MKESAPLTPKEYASEEFDGKRSAKWVRAQCHLYVTSKGKRGIPVVSRTRPYLIPPTARGLFTRPLLFVARARRAA